MSSRRAGAAVGVLALVAGAISGVAAPASAATPADCNGYNYEGPFVAIDGFGYTQQASGYYDSCAANILLSELQDGASAATAAGAVAAFFNQYQVAVPAEVLALALNYSASTVQDCIIAAQGNGIVLDVVSYQTGFRITDCRTQSPTQPAPPPCPIGQACPFSTEPDAN